MACYVTVLHHRKFVPLLMQRITIEGIRSDLWFRVNYIPVQQGIEEQVNLDDVRVVFDDIEDQYVSEQARNLDRGPLVMNAFKMMTLSQGLNLSALFDRCQL
ncbi:CBL-interacting serine/threonine-protein kinase 24-like [Silene latifolia]|uniref:CBL-interacting serine/threonine-protein kinase 24-like n=1 Tax=Silene latifolia TaxID=37657 RepID=UPI003D77BA8A